MDKLDEDLDDSALQCMTLVQKRKASASQNPKNSKQLKLSFSQKEYSCKSDEEKDGSKETKSQTCELNESSSSYFRNKKTVNSCPLCLKTFENDSNYLNHMKQCAKKKKMTTQQLLGALELQKKQIEERRAFGLCSQIVPKKTIKRTNTNSKIDSDLALGLALSKSLETETKSSEVPSQTLETFGFTASSSRANPTKKRGKVNKKSILRERTQEERQRIITEKAAVVLLDEEESDIIVNCIGQRYFIRNIEILKYHNKVCHLWRLGENDENTEWYIEEIRHRLELPESQEKNEDRTTPEKEEDQNMEEKLEEISEKNEDRTTKEKEEIQLTTEKLEEEVTQISINKEQAESESYQIKSVEVKEIQEEINEEEKDEVNVEHHTTQSNSSPEESIATQISKLKLPKNNIYQDWKTMINNEKFSDITGTTKDSKNFYLHSLVFHARCPQILEQDFKQIFQKFNLTTILIFLEYVYCGTVHSLSRTELEHLLNLANTCDYIELINVLKELEVSLTESSEGMIPSSLTPEREKEITLIENVREPDLTIVPDDVDIFENEMVDLTQSSHSSSTIVDVGNNEDSENDSIEGKSYWSILQQEKKMEEVRRKEEEKENCEISLEREKIETSMKKQHEMMKQILDEYKEDEDNALERQKIYELQRNESNDFENNNMDVHKREKTPDDCIVLSSDSETKQSKSSPQEAREFDYEIPQFDPYENYNPYSPVHSQSFITGDVSFGHDSPKKKEINGEGKELSPEYCSTPIAKTFATETSPSSTASGSFPPSTIKKSVNKGRKRKSDLSANRIIRKSLGLKAKSSSGKKIKKKEVSLEGKQLAESITNSILEELSSSPMFKLSTPLRSQKFIEMTPMGSRDIEFGEAVTPSPNYSNMGESVIKEQLAKYGLKRSLGKSKAKKILRYIYEELHPLLNTETGKLVKKLPTNTPKAKKKRKPKEKGCNGNKKAENCKKVSKKQTDKHKECSPKLNSAKDSDLNSSGSMCSLDKSTDYDSEESEFENLSEPLTQSVPNNAVDLPSVVSEYLSSNPEFHQKILLYEPIWLEEFQKKLKETFKKHFKLSDLMDYLDQQCITFRSAAQKRNNEKKNEKRRNSPRKKKNSPS